MTDGHPAGATRACPFCGESIRSEALKCRWCGEMLGPAPGAPSSGGAGGTAGPAEEKTLFEGSGSQWLNVKAFLIGGLVAVGALVLLALGSFESTPWMLWVGGGALVLAAVYLLRAFIAVRYVRYHVTNRRIQVERGWVSRHVDQVDFVRVRDVDMRQGALDRLFGIGSITVYARDATTPSFTLRGVRDPRGVYELIQTEALSTLRQRGYVEVDA